MRMFGYQPSVGVPDNISTIAVASVWVGQIFDVIADGQRNLIGHQFLIHQIQCTGIHHLPDHQTSFVSRVGTFQHLTGADTAGGWCIGFNICNGAGFPSPRMVNQQLCIDTQHLVQHIFIVYRASCHITHCKQSAICQPLCVAFSNPPEVGNRTVFPEGLSIAHLVQLCNPHTMFIRRYLLCYHIHCDLAEIQVASNPSRCRDTGGVQNIQNHPHGKVMCCQAAGL